MGKEIHLITYPRCGSTYLSKLIKHTFLKETYATHFYNTTVDESYKNKEYYSNAGTESFKKEHYIITVLRDPIDAISSLTAMEHFYSDNKNNNLDFYITQNKEYYILFFKTIPKFVDLVLNFEDINKNKDKVIKHISTETDNIIFYNNFEVNFSDDKERKFLKSSKTYDQYEYIKEKIINSDLSKCYEIYNILINECKKF
jgi:hypothetical protein